MAFVAIIWAVCSAFVGLALCDTNCSLSRREANLELCLSGIRRLAQDDDVFWFGRKSFNERCPNGPALQPSGCRVPDDITIPETIVTRTFTPGTFVPSKIDRYLDVVYTSKAGSYKACGNVYKFNATRFAVDPLSLEPVDAWYARSFPNIRWTHSQGDLFTLIVKDVGFDRLHALYYNIPGDDFTQAEAKVAYFGPGSPHRFGNVYGFMLFSQSGQIQLDQRFANVKPNQQQFNVTDFAQVHGISGPVAINWILARGDPFAVQLIRSLDLNLVDNCANFLGEAILTTPTRPFLPSKPDFTVFVNVTYFSKAIDYRICCSDFTERAKVASLNPLGNGLEKAVHVRDKPEIVFYPAVMFFNPATGFADKRYTLVMLDADVPNPIFGSNERPLIHWLVINIPNGTVADGKEVVKYLGPSPYDTHPHVYYFLLYEHQDGSSDENAYLQYVGQENCTGLVSGRCRFNVTGYTAEHNLKLVGASWMLVDNDEYVKYTVVHIRGIPEDKVCAAVPGYKKACTNSASWTPLASGLSNLVTFVVVVGMTMLIQ